MQAPRICCLLLVLILGLLFNGCRHKAATSTPIAPLNSRSTNVKSFPDSAEGLQAQFAQVIGASRSGDQAAFQAALDAMAIPNAERWFAENFETRFGVQLKEDYAMMLERYQSHVSWVAANFAKFNDFAVVVQPSESPAPLQGAGFESLLPRPIR